jgi:glycosyltransferase involved in cell wall biosynthesis
MLLLPPGDPAELVRAIDGLLSDERERARIGDAARKTVTERFSWGRNGAETAALYRELIG